MRVRLHKTTRKFLPMSKTKQHRWTKQPKGIGYPKPKCLDCGCEKLNGWNNFANYRTEDGQYHKYAPICERPRMVTFSVRRKSPKIASHVVNRVINVYESQVGELHVTCADTGSIYYFYKYNIQRVEG